MGIGAHLSRLRMQDQIRSQSWKYVRLTLFEATKVACVRSCILPTANTGKVSTNHPRTYLLRLHPGGSSRPQLLGEERNDFGMFLRPPIYK
jgi:hypothetical protein